MFGYIENDYEVLKSFELSAEKTGGIKQVFEMRKEVKDGYYEKRFSEIIARNKMKGKDVLAQKYNPYIALCGYDQDNKLVMDILFKYDVNTDNIEKDWETLQLCPDVRIENLLCSSWIENHHTGYDKSGGVTMY